MFINFSFVWWARTTKIRDPIGALPTKVLPKQNPNKTQKRHCVITLSRSLQTVRKPIQNIILMAQKWTAMMLDKERLLNGIIRIPGHKGTFRGNPLSEGWNHSQFPVMHFCSRHERQGQWMTSLSERTCIHSLTH
jgi:hypothetical protein